MASWYVAPWDSAPGGGSGYEASPFDWDELCAAVDNSTVGSADQIYFQPGEHRASRQLSLTGTQKVFKTVPGRIDVLATQAMTAIIENGSSEKNTYNDWHFDTDSLTINYIIRNLAASTTCFIDCTFNATTLSGTYYGIFNVTGAKNFALRCQFVGGDSCVYGVGCYHSCSMQGALSFGAIVNDDTGLSSLTACAVFNNTNGVYLKQKAILADSVVAGNTTADLTGSASPDNYLSGVIFETKHVNYNATRLFNSIRPSGADWIWQDSTELPISNSNSGLTDASTGDFRLLNPESMSSLYLTKLVNILAKLKHVPGIQLDANAFGGGQNGIPLTRLVN